jgi:rubredoxin
LVPAVTVHATEAVSFLKASGLPRGLGAEFPIMKAYMCLICGFVYNEEEGEPESGIAPGTRWDDVPLSWRCADCGAGKEDFEMVEI